MRILTCCLGFLSLVTCLAPVRADGEPTARLSDSGIIVPIEDRDAHVIAQRVTLTLPPPERVWHDPAIVRVEYVLRSDRREPLAIWLGWPTSGIRYQGGAPHPRCLPAIKFDGKPTGYNLLSLDDLAEPYVRGWTKQMDQLLELRPALRKQVLKVREEGTQRGQEWLAGEGMSALARWLSENRLARDVESEGLACGLLGVNAGHGGDRRYRYVERALRWLDPDRRAVNAYDELSRRWGHEALMLEPETGQIMDIRGDMIREPEFAVFRFPITLQPRQQHHLVVQYGQFLGECNRFDDPWYGLAYLMEPARRWGRWERTAIEVRAPSAWRTVAIRPPAHQVKTERGFAVYRINMGRPEENLYLSVRERPPRPLPEARWARIVGAFAGLCRSGRLDEAKEVVLAEGREEAEAALRSLVQRLRPSDSLRLRAAFAMFILGMDYRSSRAALVEHLQALKQPMTDGEAITLVSFAYRSRKDALLLDGLLELAPRTTAAAGAAMRDALARIANTMPRELLAAVGHRAGPTRESAVDCLGSRVPRRKTAAEEYPSLARIAADGADPAQAQAQRLMLAVAEAKERHMARSLAPMLIPEPPRGLHLPDGAIIALAESYPGWHVLGSSGFDDGVVATVRNRFGGSAGPQHCSGDFDGNGAEDWALLLRRDAEVALVALHRRDGDGWAAHELRRFPFDAGLQRGYDGFTIYLTPRSPGTVAYRPAGGEEKTGRLALEHEGIELHWAGKAGVLYHWTEGGYASVQTAD